MKPDDIIRLRHMIEAAQTVARYIDGRRREDLDTDSMLAFALIRCLEIFGEAASRLSPAARTQAPALPWAAIVAMRNRLIHAYFDIDLDIVWTAATAEIPPLLPVLRSLIPSD